MTNHRDRPLFSSYHYGKKGSRSESGAFEIEKKERYFSSIDAEIYFGDYYIDEIITIQYSVSQNTLPLYGYNSYTFDDVAQGNRIIQGSFVINFTSAGYLFRVLDEIKKSTGTLSNSMQISREAEGTMSEMSVGGTERQGSRPIWDAGFDIDVMFGQENSLGGATHCIIENAVITGSAMQTDTSGNPIAESYSFIARDIRTLG